jgi:hypothetical protein
VRGKHHHAGARSQERHVHLGIEVLAELIAGASRDGLAAALVPCS